MVYGICGSIGVEHVAAGESRKDHSYRDGLSRMDGHRSRGWIVSVTACVEGHCLCQFNGCTRGRYHEHAATLAKDLIVNVDANDGIGPKGIGA